MMNIVEVISLNSATFGEKVDPDNFHGKASFANAELISTPAEVTIYKFSNGTKYAVRFEAEKLIEFCFCVSDITKGAIFDKSMLKPAYRPKEMKSIKLVAKNLPFDLGRDKYDLMLATTSGGCEILYLGHWNSGKAV